MNPSLYQKLILEHYVGRNDGSRELCFQPKLNHAPALLNFQFLVTYRKSFINYKFKIISKYS